MMPRILRQSPPGSRPVSRARRLAGAAFRVLWVSAMALTEPACDRGRPAEGDHGQSLGRRVPGVVLVVDGEMGSPARFGIDRLTEVLKNAQCRVTESPEIGGSDDHQVILVGTLKGSGLIREYRRSGRLELAEEAESLAVKHLREGKRTILCAAGSDDRGLMYALLDISEQLRASDFSADRFASIPDVSESPRVPVRSMAVFLHSRDLEEEWYYSREYWDRYLTLLAGDRWNTINLVFSHQTPYLSPLYAFHVKVDEHPEVGAEGITDEDRARNLAMLRFISRTANERGIDFTLGIWQQIAWEGKHQGERQASMVKGLTRRNMGSYVYRALKKLLREVPNINAVQLRLNHESGLDYDEQAEFYKNSVFRAIKEAGRPILLENRNVGFLRETLQAALDTGLRTRVSHKYWGEHMVFPYHPTRIMWTYSYGDWLRYPRTYENIFQVWSLGSHRLFVWGDPEFVRRFAPTTTFQNAAGFEICAPLSQKGFGNPPGTWRIFKDPDREYYDWEFERYWSFYRLFGRLTYNPEASDEIWLRDLRRRFGDLAAPDMAEAYRNASRILPLIIGQATADYNMYIWPEKDMGGLINFYLHECSFDKDRISSLLEFVARSLRGKSSAKLVPPDSARRLEGLAEACEAALDRAIAGTGRTAGKELWATAHDFRILSGLARYFSRKIRAAVNLGAFYSAGDLSSLNEALSLAEEGLKIWEELSAVADEIYSGGLVMGPDSIGHWKDNIAFVRNDLEQVRYQKELFDTVGHFDYGFDFGPKAYNRPTEIYTPWYVNAYAVEHRFQGVFPHSLFNPQQGFGWNEEAELTSERPAQVGTTVWRAANVQDMSIPSQALLADSIQGRGSAVFRIDLPEGHYQAAVIITDRAPRAKDHGPMSVAVVERFGERAIMTDRVIRKGETVIEKFNFNMVGSRYNRFLLKLSAPPGSDFIISGLTLTRVEPHIAHVPVRLARPNEPLTIRATVTLPERVLTPVKDSLSVARGTTSTIDPPEKIAGVKVCFSVDGGRTYASREMKPGADRRLYTASLPQKDIGPGEIRYFIEAWDSIGQTVHFPGREENDEYVLAQVTDDRKPPSVRHIPAKECRAGESLTVRAEIEDESGVKEAILHYRPTRQAMEYSKATLVPQGRSVYEAIIPGGIITTEFDLMYYIEAVDRFGNGTFFPDWDAGDPHIIVGVRR